MEKIISLWNGQRQLVQFMLILLVWSVFEGMVTFYMPLHVDAQLQSVALVGLFLGLNSVSSTITDLIFAFVSDLSDYRKFLYIGLAMDFAMIPLLIWGQGWVPILLLVILWGAEFEMISRLGSMLFLAKHTPHGRYEQAANAAFMVRHLGYFIGPVIADYVRMDSLTLMYVVMGALVVFNAALMYAIFVRHPGRHAAHKVHHLTVLSELQIIRRHFRKVLPHFLLGFGAGAVEGFILVFGPIYFSESSHIAGLIVGFALLTYSLMSPVIFFAEKRIRVYKIVIFLILLSVTAAVLANVVQVELTAVFILLLAAGNAGLYLLNEATFVKMLAHIRRDEEDEVVSVMALGPNTAYALVAFIGGLLITNVGFPVVLALVVCVILMPTAFVFSLHARRFHQKLASTAV